jgi:hypothetical protein
MINFERNYMLTPDYNNDIWYRRDNSDNETWDTTRGTHTIFLEGNEYVNRYNEKTTFIASKQKAIYFTWEFVKNMTKHILRDDFINTRLYRNACETFAATKLLSGRRYLIIYPSKLKIETVLES